MSSNSSKRKRVLMGFGLPVWVFLGFMLAQALVLALIAMLQAFHVPLGGINPIIFNTVGGIVIYGLAIGIVIGLPWLIKHRKTTLAELGLQRLPKWMDFVWTLAGVVVYFVLSALVTYIASHLLPFVNMTEAQDTGYKNLSSQLEYILAFISLVIVAPFCEELLFRGYLLGKLRKYTQFWVSLLITSVLFAIVHFQWNVGFDVFALSVVLCLLRLVSGSLWSSIMLHMLKNGIAYYFLFINTGLLSTMGR